MEARGDQDEAMQNGVVKRQPPPQGEDDTDRIEDATGRQQGERRGVERRRERMQRDKADPAEPEIEGHGYGLDAPRLPKLQRDADGSDRPDRDRRAGRPAALEAGGGERRGGAGDHG